MTATISTGVKLGLHASTLAGMSKAIAASANHIDIGKILSASLATSPSMNEFIKAMAIETLLTSNLQGVFCPSPLFLRKSSTRDTYARETTISKADRASLYYPESVGSDYFIDQLICRVAKHIGPVSDSDRRLISAIIAIVLISTAMSAYVVSPKLIEVVIESSSIIYTMIHISMRVHRDLR